VVIRGTEECKTEKKKSRRWSGSRSRRRGCRSDPHHPIRRRRRKKTSASRSPIEADGEAPRRSRSGTGGTERKPPGKKISLVRHHTIAPPPVFSREWVEKQTRRRESSVGPLGGFHWRRERAWRFHHFRASHPPPPPNHPKSPARTSARPSPRKIEGGVVSLGTDREEGKAPRQPG
jgi:hypothetical protein